MATSAIETLLEVPAGGAAIKEEESLQHAFQKFRMKKKTELLAAEKSENRMTSNDEDRATLRTMFMDRAKSYIGTPYAQRYHTPDSPLHDSKLFLDCCGLVRKVVKDLKNEFGFDIGPWNQAYMFDTLPVVMDGPAAMLPGDLVFISGIYNNPKAKPQHHNMVHVEIWAGEGEKTIGARWHHGCVEVHESYMFSAKSYHSMEYHFRSIDTWLHGQCHSFCSDHQWLTKKTVHSKYSIFSTESEKCKEHEGDKDEVKKDEVEEAAYVQLQEQTHPQDNDSHDNDPHDDDPHDNNAHGNEQDTGLNLDSTVQLGPCAIAKKKPVVASKHTTPSFGRLFTTSGKNGTRLVEEYLLSKGWKKSSDKSTFTLRWAEMKHHINYKDFHEGEQIVNHISNINIFTTKIGLLDCLRSYYKLYRPRTPLTKFFPTTYRLDMATEREEFYQTFQAGEMWICKPTLSNQGRGIFIVRQLEQISEKLEQDERNCKPNGKPTARIVQRYISPLLLLGRKFDLRVYMLLMWGGEEWLVFQRQGYARLCCEPYEATSDLAQVHLTNQSQQKKHPQYGELKEDTVWSFQKLQSKLSEEHGLPEDWVSNNLHKQLKNILSTCFKSVKHKLSRAVGCFELLGFDFMIDDSYAVWLIEANFNPALHTNCDTLAQITPAVVQESIDIAIEVFDKSRKNKSILPIQSGRDFNHVV